MFYKHRVKCIRSAEYHRNGVGGVGFYAIVFDSTEDGTMVAALFQEAGFCAVLQLDKLAAENVRFGENSWRGDEYEAELRPALIRFLGVADPWA